MFHALLASGYKPEETWPKAGYIGSARYCPAGISGNTCQESGSWCSLHNYVLAIDLEYDKNPHLKITRPDPTWMFARCKISRVNVDAIEAIRTNSGAQVWLWLGWSIGDTMHVQINCSKADIASGINYDTVLGWGDAPPVQPPSSEEGVFMAYAKKGDRSEAVAEIQTFLVGQGFDLGAWGPAGNGADGVWGGDTTNAVASFQNAHAITEYDYSTKAPITRGDYWGPRSSGFVAGMGGGTAPAPIEAYTKAESDAKFAPKAHNHDGAYVKNVTVTK
jgi:hypothetical protein